MMQDGDRCIVVVADGAGGSGSGDAAAEMVVQQIKSHYKAVHSADDWASLLGEIDQQIGSGETTAVVVDLRPYGIAGASVGDSQAWLVEEGTVTDLTAAQTRKPLLGSGSAQPVGFTHQPLSGMLIAATDGVFDYAKQESIIELLVRCDFYEIPRRCVELVRLPSGELWDDTSIVVARNKPQQRTRQRFEI